MMEAGPWLFSERDVRDLMRLKNPLLLDSRFLSVPSCKLVDGPLTEGSLEQIKNNSIRTIYLYSNMQMIKMIKHLVTSL